MNSGLDLTSEVTAGLLQLHFPTLYRPALGPNDPPTLELARFDLISHSYATIAYFRDLLNGYLLLRSSGNVTSVDLVARGIFEWTMLASYISLKISGPMNAADFVECRKIMERVKTGNSWIKRHGEKYADGPIEDDILDSLRIKHLEKAYKEYQVATRGSETVEDDYGYLSEHAHPNSLCLVDFQDFQGRALSIVSPKLMHRNEGIVGATAVEWLMCTHGILELANEFPIRSGLAAMLRQLAKRSGGLVTIP